MGKKSIRLVSIELILALTAFVSHIGGIAISSQTGSLVDWSLWEINHSTVVMMLLTVAIAACVMQLNSPEKDHTMAITGFAVLSATASAILCMAGLYAQTLLPEIVNITRIITLLASAAMVGVTIHFPTPSLSEELEED